MIKIGVTTIHPIKQSFNSKATSVGALGSIMYAVLDKVKEIDFDKMDFSDEEQRKEVMDVLNYATGEKRYDSGAICQTISSYINCTADPYGANKEMVDVRKRFGKENDDVIAFHLIQSIEESPAEVDVNLFNRIGVDLACEVFEGFQCVVSTHTNTDNIHNHIIINAVNMFTGKKWNDCDYTKNLIREASDRILEKHGFAVLEETRKFQRYYRKDRDAETHLRMTDYRTTQAYSDGERRRVSAKDIVKADIDLLLPFCKSYDELVERLIENRYQIRYKNAKGEYYKHITFKPAFRQKGIRDYMLSEDEYYTRENLTRIIDEQNKQKENDFEGWAQAFEQDVEHHTIRYSLKDNKYYRFKFGGKYLDELNEKYRELINEDGEAVYRFRSTDDVAVIRDIKYYHELLQEESKDYWKNKSFKRENDSGYEAHVWNNKKLKYYFDRIMANSDALAFAEKEGFYSLKEVNAMVELLYNQRKNIDNQFFAIKKLIAEYGDDVVVVNQYRDTMAKLEELMAMPDCPKERIEQVKGLAESYLERLSVRGLDALDKQDKLLENYKEYKERFVELMDATKDVTEKLKAYHQYMQTMRYISNNTTTGNGVFDSDLETYDYIRKINQKKTVEMPRNDSQAEREEEMQKEREKNRQR